MYQPLPKRASILCLTNWTTVLLCQPSPNWSPIVDNVNNSTSSFLSCSSLFGRSLIACFCFILFFSALITFFLLLLIYLFSCSSWFLCSSYSSGFSCCCMRWRSCCWIIHLCCCLSWSCCWCSFSFCSIRSLFRWSSFICTVVFVVANTVVVCVDILIILLCIEFGLTLSLSSYPNLFFYFFYIPSSISLNLTTFSLPFLELLASDSGHFLLHLKSKRFVCLCHS